MRGVPWTDEISDKLPGGSMLGLISCGRDGRSIRRGSDLALRHVSTGTCRSPGSLVGATSLDLSRLPSGSGRFELYDAFEVPPARSCGARADLGNSVQ